MLNERLRRAMLRAGHDTDSLAEAAGVAGKSVQRWIASDVTPYPRTRYRVAAILGEDESYLWPQAVNSAALAGAELAATWPRRCDVPAHLWTDLLRAASRNVDVLAFAGLFLTEEHSGWLPALKQKATSGVRVRIVLRNDRGELLLLRRADTGRWTIPTGALKKNETLTQCAIRECREETGLAAELTGLAGVYSDPRHRIAYADGEVRVPVNVCFTGRPAGGELRTDAESTDAAWVAPEDLDRYEIHPAIMRRIRHALGGGGPHVD